MLNTPNGQLSVTDDGTNYQCVSLFGHAVTYNLSWGPGQALGGVSIPVHDFTFAATLIAVSCRIEVQAGASTSVDVRIAADGSPLSGASSALSAPCNANGTAATRQALTATTTSIPALGAVGIVGAGSWGSTASGEIKITVAE
jgi:hypothetical protein